MKKVVLIVSVILFFGMVSCNQKKSVMNYPKTKQVEQEDEYFGVKVKDPYRWLEDDHAEDTKDWVKAQNKVTADFLNKIPYRNKIKDRLTEVWNYPKTSAPFKKKGHYFMYKNSGLQNQSVIYIMKDLEDEGKVFLDPNTLSKDGTVSLTNFSISDDGKYAAYGVSRGGSDWREFYVRDIKTGKDLKDHIMWAKFSSIAWYKDGFFYTRYPKPEENKALSGVNTNSKVYYHKIGDTQDKDQLIYEDSKNPQRGFGVQVTDDKAYLIIYATESTSGNALYFKSLKKKNAKIEKIVTNFDYDYGVIGHYDNHFYVKTNDNAPRYKVIKINPKKSAKKYWEDLIPEQEMVLRGIGAVGHQLIANYMKDAHSVISIFNMNGTFKKNLDVELGTVSGFHGDIEDDITFFTVTNFTTPSTIYKYDVKHDKVTLYKKSAIDFDASVYETKQVFFPSKDGTKVPMFIVYKKGLEMNGKNPTLLYGYGGFNISLTPSFRVSIIPWLEKGGVYAMANIRGGGEYGEAWHKSGTIMKKQNVFDDFIAAAEYLIDNKYTDNNHLGIQGGSNGGLLVGAVTNQRPDLFQVAIPQVGVMDMLRYHKFTIGRYWATDYGTSEDSKEMFEYLKAYSPLHSVKENVDYPAIMVTTADHDDRVVPAHSFKYIATIQAKETGDNPTIIRIETQAGHGAGTPTSKAIEQAADLLSFLWYNMGFTPNYK